jgi:uncharacterized protein YodC (DUF2158 family)
MWAILRYRLLGPRSRFNKGDGVELKSGGPLMVIVQILRSHTSKEPLIKCKWYDRENNCDRAGVFAESQLRLFDWYNTHSIK